MVKLQKPIPKNLGNKPKLNNPIKEKKQQLKKEKSAISQKAKLLEDSTPVKEAKVLPKPGKEVITKKQQKKELNGEKKSAKKPLILVPESPEQTQNAKGKKNKAGKEKNVAANGVQKATNGVKQADKPAEVSKKNNKKTTSVEKTAALEKPAKQAKKVKAPAVKEISAPVKLAPPTKAKPAPVPAQPTKVKAAPTPAPPAKAKSAPVPAAPKADATQKKSAKTAPAPTKAQKTPATPAPESNAAAKQGKAGKKQKNKKKTASAPEPVPVVEKIKKPKKPIIALQEKKKAKIAHKKAKLTSKGDASKTEKKPKEGSTFRYDPIPYDEEKFHSIVNTENIKKIAEALKTTVEKEVKTKKSMIFDDYRYFLEVASFKIPSCPKRMVKLNLKHSLVGKDDDVLLVVPDLKRGGKVDYEPTKHHYEDLLLQNGVEGITVMPMNQLRKEYQTFEQKRRLCASYEYFMCDGRIVAHVGALVGKFTQKPRNTFHAVRLNENKDIKAEIEKALKKTAFRQLVKSSLQSIPVGSHKYSSKQLAENVEHVVSQLKTVFPGGLGNIRSLHLKIGLTGTSSLPLYMSMAQAPEETPMVLGPREERMIKLKREANEVLAKFTMTKDGKLIKLAKPAADKKRKLMEMKAALKEDEVEEPAAKNAKKSKKDDMESGKNKKTKEVKELELPENEEEEGDDSDDDDDEDVVQLGQGSDDETEDDDMANLDEEDTESGAEIVENGFVGEDDEESEEDDEQEVNQSENDEDDDEEDEEDDDEEEDDEEESD
ncbi:ribosomal L1 domain-containing protein CG13096 [Eupeodes corollae]|uniref:ribosomal L1 domain-containing protein CG13096 n=1 Tax=Eupeodes corollae TaxID=290404 RepID=UPI002491AE7C|nr:ribosomal L1 domain-containing protein CG13096 [Eupeodes corollae]